MHNVRLFELKHSADKLIKIVIAHATGGPSTLIDVRQRVNPLKQAIRPASALNFTSNGFIELAIHCLQPGVYRSRPAIEPRCDRINADYRLRSFREMSVKAVKLLQALAKLTRIEERWLVV
jgi:hypothetical protein